MFKNISMKSDKYLYNNNLITHFKKHILFYCTFFFILTKSLIFFRFLTSTDNYIFVCAYIIFTSSFIVFLLSFALLLKPSIQKWYLLSINLFISILFIIDLLYYNAFKSVPSIYSVKQFEDAINVIDSVFSLIQPEYIVFFIDIIILLIIFLSKKYNKETKSIKSFIILFALSFLFISLVPLETKYLHNKKNFTIFYSQLGYHFSDIYVSLFKNNHIDLTKQDINNINKWYAKKNKQILPDNKYKSIFKGKNVIIIQFESLENFVINRKINNKEITPNLNKLLRHSFYFSNIYDQTREGTSSDANLMVNTSIYPIKNGSTFYKYADNTYNSLPKILEKYNYSTIDIYPIRGDFWNWKNVQKSFGYDNFMDCFDFNINQSFGMGISDKCYLRQVEPVIFNMQKPFLAFICNLSSHVPFDLPYKYRELKLSKKLNKSHVGGYFESIHYSDKYIGKFINNLKQKDGLEDMVVVIYGDHIGVHKYYEQELNNLSSNKDWLKNNARIPLIIYNENLDGKKITKTGGLVDVLPTLCYLLGVDKEYYINSAMGRNLLNTDRSFAVLPDKTFIGQAINKKYKRHAIKSLDIADLIIRGDYFAVQDNK